MFTVEHILPENAVETWGGYNFEGINRSGYRIVNLTIIEKKLNQAAGQRPFAEKKSMFQQSRSELTKLIPEQFETWNESKLAAG